MKSHKKASHPFAILGVKERIFCPRLVFRKNIRKYRRKRGRRRDCIHRQSGKKDHGTKLIRRIRTAVWRKTKYGKASESITYRKLRIGKKLAKVIENARLKQPE